MAHQIDGGRYNTGRRNYVINAEQTKESGLAGGKAAKNEQDGRKMSARLAKAFLSLLTLAIIGSLVFVLWHFWLGKPKDPLPPSIKQSVSYPLYYPTAEPAGYSLDKPSIKNTNGTIFYNLTKASVAPIVISQQLAPPNFDPRSMFQHNPLPSTISPLGTIYDLSYKNQSRFMITTNDSLIFISSAARISSAQLQQIVNGLKLSQ